MNRVGKLLDQAAHGTHSSFSGAVVLAYCDGNQAIRETVGTTIGTGAGIEFAVPRKPVSIETLFDLASITKIFTAAALLAVLAESGGTSATLVSDYLPEFRDAVLRKTTVKHLLSHTAGWDSEWSYQRKDATAWTRFRRARPQCAPGRQFQYSCMSYIWAGLLAETIAGERLDAIVARTILVPLRMRNTLFVPSQNRLDSIASTEYQVIPARGLVHGEVHDETSWALGGVSGNAGLFATAPDLMIFLEMLRRGGTHEGARILPRWVVDGMTTDQLEPDVVNHPQFGQGLGPQIGDTSWMGDLGRLGAAGHIGFTGTSVIFEPHGRRSLVFLTNRVHPSRHGAELSPLRVQVANEFASL